MLALGELYVARPDPNIYNYVNTNLMSVVYNNIDKSWLFGQWWEGPVSTSPQFPSRLDLMLTLVPTLSAVERNDSR